MAGGGGHTHDIIKSIPPPQVGDPQTGELLLGEPKSVFGFFK